MNNTKRVKITSNMASGLPHSFGYIAESIQEAVDDFYPGYARTMTKLGKERGWHKVTRTTFDTQLGPEGALLVGDPEEIVEKIIRHSKSLDGISRITFMMNPASLSRKTHADHQVNRYSSDTYTSQGD